MSPADINGDGDRDIVFLAYNGIFWFENSNGLGNFHPIVPNAIIDVETEFIDRSWIGAFDIDGDGDLDVVAVETGETVAPYDNSGAIVWYENEDGKGNFGDRKLIADETGSSDSIFTSAIIVDVDGDGDLDVVSNNTCRWLEPVVAPRISWYEQLDGEGSFGPPQPVDMERGATYSTDVLDIDNDGDLDLLSTTGGPAWGPLVVSLVAYSNPGTWGDFGSSELIVDLGADIVHNAWMGPSLATADLDGDGDRDAIVAGYLDGKVTWYENTTGPSYFGAEQVIATSDSAAIDVVGGDFNGDDATDLAAIFQDHIVWFENRLIGDVNRDRVFNSGDLVHVLIAGEYEDGTAGNSTFDTGDWNLDGDFDSSDLVLAFQAGTYDITKSQSMREIAAAIDQLFAANRHTLKTQVADLG